MAHWYTREGKAMHEVKDSKGNLRPTTLRDARKLNLLPSVTTVGKMMAGGMMLENWKIEQALLAALRHPGGLPKYQLPAGEALSTKTSGLSDWLSWCKDDAMKQVRDAAERGNAIHDALRLSFTDPDEVPAQFLAHVDAVRDKLSQMFGPDRVWRSEQSFAHRLGFGGSIDLESEDGEDVFVDFKCKEFDADKPASAMVFDDHLVQLGGYTIGRNKRGAKCVNFFISTKVPGLVVAHEHKPEDIAKGQAMFLALNALWKAKNGYDGSWE